MATFNFVDYLTSQISSLISGQITIQPLTGGFTNLTVRATFTPSIHFLSREIDSIILKYASPFVASAPTQPMSIYRQTVEAKALNILAGSSRAIIETSKLLATFPKLRIPILIFHDTKQNVLWISDLGDTQTLPEYLMSKPDTPAIRNEIESIASQLVHFTSELYRITANPSSETLEYLSNASTTTDIFILLANMTKSTLLEAGVPDAEKLASYVKGFYDIVEEPCLGMVDFWPPNVLIDSEGNCGLVDWEYFGLSNPASELGMFLAHLHVIILNDKSSATAIEHTQLFISHYLRTWASTRSTPLSPCSRHHVLISHGRELVSALELYSKTLDDLSKTRILWAGVTSLRAAGASEKDLDLSFFEDHDDTSNIWKDFTILGF